MSLERFLPDFAPISAQTEKKPTRLGITFLWLLVNSALLDRTTSQKHHTISQQHNQEPTSDDGLERLDPTFS
jgi:hypothetical protein